MKNNNLLPLSVLIAAVLISGTIFLSTKNKKTENVQESSITTTEQRENAVKEKNIDNDKICFNQAQKIFAQYKKDNEGGLIQSNSSNHYNKKMQKCFVEISSISNSGVSNSYIADAFENKILIGCLSGGSIKGELCSIPAVSSSTGEYQKIDNIEAKTIISNYMTK